MWVDIYTDMIRCKHCGWQQAHNATRQMTHLRLCQNYQVHLQSKYLAHGLPCGPLPVETVSETLNPGQEVHSEPEHSRFTAPVSIQATISRVQRISAPVLHQIFTEEKHQLHRKAALAVYMSGQPFSLRENQ